MSFVSLFLNVDNISEIFHIRNHHVGLLLHIVSALGSSASYVPLDVPLHKMF